MKQNVGYTWKRSQVNLAYRHRSRTLECVEVFETHQDANRMSRWFSIG